jgi:quercetin dioxygenase-like cupin family protein
MTPGSYPHTIDNGAGERLTFLRRVSSPDGDWLEVENRVAPRARVPMHVHHCQEEALTVRQGLIGYQRLGQEPQVAGPGETVTFEAGEAHRFWNAGEDELHCVGHIAPADNIEFFLGALFESTRRNGGTRPDPFDAAFLLRRYRSEFSLLEVPALAQLVVLPVLVAVGTLLGRYRKFAGAPRPVRR